MKRWLDRLCIKYLSNRQFIVAQRPLLAKTLSSLKSECICKDAHIKALRRLVKKEFDRQARDRDMLRHKEYTIMALSMALDDAEGRLDSSSGR